MKRSSPIPFPFVLDELQPVRPAVRHAFGFVYVYVGDKLVCGLRIDREWRPENRKGHLCVSAVRIAEALRR